MLGSYWISLILASLYGGNTASGPSAVSLPQNAIVQYVTDQPHLCSAVMQYESLGRLGSQAERVLLYPSHWDLEGSSTEGKLLLKAQTEYHVKLIPIEVQTRKNGDVAWPDRFIKLQAFNLTQYNRVMILDSDAIIRQNMDEIFQLPEYPFASPRAYWLEFGKRPLTSSFMLVKPSESEFNRVWEAIQQAGNADSDTKILNDLYHDSAIVIPHRPYHLLTGEFRAKDHANYLGSPHATWDPDVILQDAKYLHFSDAPVSKPWIKTPAAVMEKTQPDCEVDTETGIVDCRARDYWLGFYKDFAERREMICGAEFVPQLDGEAERAWLSLQRSNHLVSGTQKLMNQALGGSRNVVLWIYDRIWG